MKTEIEVKFLNVNPEKVRTKLRDAGAVLEEPMRDMKRQVFYTADHDPDAYVRVRNEGDKVTMTYKRFDSDGLHGAKEAEIAVSDFETTIEIIKNTGLEPKSYQETRRETWRIGTTEIVIDEWPWLTPFIEIEGTTEEDVRAVAAKLGYDWESEAVFGPATQAYRAAYDVPEGFIADQLPEIRFGAPLPDILTPKSS